MDATTGTEGGNPEAVSTPATAVAEVQTNTETSTATQDRGADGKFVKPVQPRIDELTRNWREAQREGAYWRERAEAKEAEKAEAAKPKKPEPSDFDDYSKYVEALTDFKADEKVDAKLNERETRTAEQQTAKTRQEAWNLSQTEARKTIADFDAVLDAADMPVADHVADAVYESELKAKLQYHLAKNPDVLDRLNKLPQRAADREIGRIEAELLRSSATPEPEQTDKPAEPAKPPVATVPKTTKAPPPAKPLPTARSTTTPLEKQGMDDYLETRKGQGARWAR